MISLLYSSSCLKFAWQILYIHALDEIFLNEFQDESNGQFNQLNWLYHKKKKSMKFPKYQMSQDWLKILWYISILIMWIELRLYDGLMLLYE